MPGMGGDDLGVATDVRWLCRTESESSIVVVVFTNGKGFHKKFQDFQCELGAGLWLEANVTNLEHWVEPHARRLNYAEVFEAALFAFAQHVT